MQIKKSVIAVFIVFISLTIILSVGFASAGIFDWLFEKEDIRLSPQCMNLNQITVTPSASYITAECPIASEKAGEIADCGHAKCYGTQAFCIIKKDIADLSTLVVVNLSLTPVNTHAVLISDALANAPATLIMKGTPVISSKICPEGFSVVEGFADCGNAWCYGNQYLCVKMGKIQDFLNKEVVADFMVTDVSKHITATCPEGYSKIGDIADCGYAKCYGSQAVCAKYQKPCTSEIESNSHEIRCIDVDMNLDDKVNVLDLIIIRNSLGVSGCAVTNNYCNRKDINRDGAVNFTDLENARNHLNRICSTSETIPESCLDYDFDCNGISNNADVGVLRNLKNVNLVLNFSSVLYYAERCFVLGDYLEKLYQDGFANIPDNKIAQITSRIEQCSALSSDSTDLSENTNAEVACNNVDAKGDNKINILDIILIRNNLGRTLCNIENSFCDGNDVNRDGTVSQDDLIYVRAMLNKICSTGEIPEMACRDYDFDCNGRVNSADSAKVESFYMSNSDVNINSIYENGIVCSLFGNYLLSLWKKNLAKMNSNELSLARVMIASCSSQVQPASCADSDGGVMPDVKGSLIWFDGTSEETFNDRCIGDSNLTEYSCSTSVINENIQCENGCSDGACIIRQNNGGAGEGTQNNGGEEVIETCLGCLKDNNCYSAGYRLNDEYCSSQKQFVAQVEEDSNCANNFECKSNVCIGDKCISRGFLQQIIDFFRRLFGAG